MENIRELLIDKALSAREKAYAPYSKFKVGASLLTSDNKIFTGFNIENASYSLCMCGERNAIYNAYLNGYNKDSIKAICIVADTDGVVSPCGACRQVMSELLNKDTDVILCNINKKTETYKVGDLLPFSFSGDDMKNV